MNDIPSFQQVLTSPKELTIMVYKSFEKKADAAYLLHQVHALAARESVLYAGTRVQIDTTNLGYGLREVCWCLTALQPADFSHSERYAPHGKWHDVYKTIWAPPGEMPDALYVKFRLADDILILELCSFHLHR
jgi:hypothetical protein